MAKIKSVYICSECGHESPKWYGKCPSCGEWNTMNEEIKDTAVNENRKIFLGHLSKHNNTPDIARETVSRITGIKRYKLDCLEFLGDTRTLEV